MYPRQSRRIPIGINEFVVGEVGANSFNLHLPGGVASSWSILLPELFCGRFRGKGFVKVNCLKLVMNTDTDITSKVPAIGEDFVNSWERNETGRAPDVFTLQGINAYGITWLTTFSIS